MSDETYRIREFRSGDYPAEARVWTRVDPGRVTSAEEIQRFEEKLFTPPMILFKVVVEQRASGEAAGFGYLQSDLESFDPATFWGLAAVDPDHQGNGLGRSLMRTVQLEAERRNARRLWAAVRLDDDRAVRFLERQGFTERRRSWRSRLDLSTAARLPDRTEALAREGISFTTLAEEDLDRPEVLRDLYDLTNATSADEPRLGPFTPISFEQFVERDLHGPTFLADAFFLARAGGRFVAMSSLHRAEGQPEVLEQRFTGTRRDFRGRGIATELKRRTVEYGRTRGYRSIRTGNDSRNDPMLAINRKLGFRPEVQRIHAEKLLG